MQILMLSHQYFHVMVWQVLKVTWPLKWSWQNIWLGGGNDKVIHTCVCDYWWCKRFPTSSSVCQFEGYLRFPIMWKHDKYSWVWAWSLFSFLMVFLFDFWLLILFWWLDTIHFGMLSYRWKHEGTEWIRPCQVPWGLSSRPGHYWCLSGEVTMLVTTYSGLSDRPDTVIWWCHYAKVTRTTKADPCRRQKQKQNRK